MSVEAEMVPGTGLETRSRVLRNIGHYSKRFENLPPILPLAHHRQAGPRPELKNRGVQPVAEIALQLGRLHDRLRSRAGVRS